MGRLSALILPLAFAALACENGGTVKPEPPVTGRSNAVTAPNGSAGTTPASATASAKPSAAPAAPRKLCADTTARPAPKGALKTAAAPGATALPGSISFGVGKWVWVNLWAAWCGPCKEEMPRLQNFQSRLRNAGVMIDLAFVSLDDDERQLSRFLEAQGQGGVRASYWLPEGGGRDTWIGALGVKDAGNLPVHALVAPSGQLACLIQGAVEETDYQAIADIVGAKR
ncbi:TlpA family protein disulfide reductase [Polyangium sp. 15x6]|uniref:TlpA family protein disulfide reductase n=1 Tax=Polyangium sp. 15x6 TaxID=3042687 RepID=UPI002499DF52|nr:TlpA family protein disulfide reductase [Polyangium sp. 15x6]MDI3289667.1 TlpA family protein disulfide reductase [Polyangium sp. 15x6]